MVRHKQANYEVVAEESTREVLVIRDVGPHDEYLTVTNAAGEVVAALSRAGLLGEGRRLYYYDSLGARDEILHEGGRFRGFLPARGT